MNTLAIDIGGTKFSAALFEADHLALRETRRTDRQGGPEAMMRTLGGIISGWRFGRAIHRCGIGFGGPVIFSEQRLAFSTHVGGWDGFPLVSRIQEISGAPAVMDNDANTGGLGEAVHGAAKGVRPVFYMTLSTGIGGGVILDSGIYRGADSWAGELGHINIRPGGPECLCGSNGCLERLCCGLWLERDHGRPAHELMGDPEFVRRYVGDLAAGLKACIMLLNPACVVIGGGISKAGDRLFVPLREELARQMTSWSRARIDIRQAALGDDSVLFGALELAKEAFPI